MSARLVRKDLLDIDSFRAAVNASEQPLKVFKEALQNGRNLLHEFHLEGGSPATEVAHHTWLIDALLGVAWDSASAEFPGSSGAALIAVGGYGRSELHPYSDIDLLILLPTGHGTKTKAFAEHLVRFLWDIGLEVGHSVRTVKQCVSEARNDLTIVTNLMESRPLNGDKNLHDQLMGRIGPNRIWPVKKYFGEKWREQQARYARFEDTAYNLEPHVKEGPGGLRDIQMILWVTQRYFGASDFHELVERGFLTEDENRSLIRGRNFLWRLRASLHWLAGRREDRLLFDYQREIATEFGYEDKPGNLAVEQLMKRYYRSIKDLHLLNEMLLQHFQEAILKRGRSKITTINRRFRAVDGFLEVSSERVFERHPFALLELFLILQQHDELKGARAETIRLVRANLHRINAQFRRDIRARSLFMEIFRHSTGLTHALRNLNNYGVLGAYLPDFGRVVGQMQHDLFHVYTVDAHLLFVVRNLRRFAVPKHREEFPLASDIMANLFKPYRLYLAGLFHDIAKGRGGDHSELGEKDALHICRQHDLSESDANFVAWLVRQHLLMSWTAQKQDITDPEVVNRFASIVGDQEHLDNLYLLTIADIRGTSPHVWNTWKGQLLYDLYSATRRALRLGLSEPVDLREKICIIKEDVLRSMPQALRNRKAVEALWSQLEQEYFVRNDPDTISWHTEALLNARASEIPVVEVRHLIRLEALQFLVLAPYSNSLFANVAGAFERSRLNIADARVHRMDSGMVLLAFLVLTDKATETRSSALQLLARNLRQKVIEPESGKVGSSRRVSRALKHFPTPTSVSIYPHPSGQYSTMELVTRDRPGLLHLVARGLIDCKVDLVSARVSTFGERVEDIFMITDRDGEPVTDIDQQNCIKDQIASLLNPGNAAPV
ncbi:MAG: bifunctional uridylyltransferase/uridylyl-removing enzyme [marine bacterium B5-7]|nr:MAG: bifunctional uridylyltransferase/uridylyl-removing enzyme [marine bacterium B5-7]